MMIPILLNSALLSTMHFLSCFSGSLKLDFVCHLSLLNKELSLLALLISPYFKILTGSPLSIFLLKPDIF
jgi:hypothetical protein